VDDRGRLYTGLEDGRIIRITGGDTIDTVADTGGRPLGVAFSRAGRLAGRLIVADARRGLLAVDVAGDGDGGGVEILSTEAGGVRFGFTDHLDVASDGIIYFTDASSAYGYGDHLHDLLEARPHGRFLAYDPATGETAVLMDGLHFANGVALAAGEDFVLVNETYRYRIHRYWLKGPRRGSSEILIENLPGFPDNLARASNGNFWVCLFTVRNPMMDRLHPHPLLKRLLAKLPRFVWPGPKPYGLIVEIDPTGGYVRSLHDPTGETLKEITGAVEHDGHLYLGSLHGDRIGKISVR
jgi:sugar lactone lactonase YvrE